MVLSHREVCDCNIRNKNIKKRSLNEAINFYLYSVVFTIRSCSHARFKFCESARTREECEVLPRYFFEKKNRFPLLYTARDSFKNGLNF